MAPAVLGLDEARTGGQEKEISVSFFFLKFFPSFHCDKMFIYSHF